MSYQHSSPQISPKGLNQELWHQITKSLGDAYEIMLLSAIPKDKEGASKEAFTHFVCEIRLRQHTAANCQTQQEVFVAQPFLQAARQVVMAHLDSDDFNYRHLAKHLCLSVSQMNKRLGTMAGQSGNEFIKTVRLEQAKHLLMHTNARINEIAFETGFPCLARFDQAFKKIVGVSPTAYRVAFKNKGQKMSMV